jgi:hypothetical protein
VSLRFGHVQQQLGAAPAAPSEACTLVCITLPSLNSLPTSITVPGLPGIPAIPGSGAITTTGQQGSPPTATPAARSSPTALETRTTGIGLLRPWLLLGFGVWGSSVLTFLYVTAMLIHRRRLEGTLT